MTDKVATNRMTNYLIGSDLMVELEEAEHARYLKNFDFIVQLTRCDENLFSFPITVWYHTLFMYMTC